MVKTIEGGSSGEMLENPINTSELNIETLTDKQTERMREISENSKKKIEELVTKTNIPEDLQEVMKRTDISPELRGILEETCDGKAIENLMHGTLNLINEIAVRAHEGKPVDTIVFLDKSARNAHYVYDKLWRGLEERKELPEDIHKPKVRFMNIGSDEQSSKSTEQSLAVLKSKLNDEDFAKEENVLIVDEIIIKGNASRAALKTMENLYDFKLDSISQFQDTPRWYGHGDLGILGVEESKTAGELNLKRALDKITPEDLTDTQDTLEKLGKESFSKLLTDSCRHLKNKQWNPDEWKPLDLQETRKNMNNLSITENDIEITQKYAEILLDDYELGRENWRFWGNTIPEFTKSLEDYLHTADGYFTSPLGGLESKDQSKTDNFKIYRHVLKGIVDDYLQSRDKIETS